jgi:hypothetical protein
MRSDSSLHCGGYLQGVGRRASILRINSMALSIASRNAFSRTGEGRRFSPANRRTKNIPPMRWINFFRPSSVAQTRYHGRFIFAFSFLMEGSSHA